MNKFTMIMSALCVGVSLNANAANCTDPKAFVEDVKNSVLAVVTSSQSDEQKKAVLDKDFRATADIGWMGKFALGRSYASLNPQQQQDYAGVYADYMTASYVNRFKKYDGQEITVNTVKPVNSDFEVDTTISRKSDAPIDVVYRLKPENGCFKVVDITAEGVSLVNTQRQDFNSVYNSQGYDKLIGLLKQKTAQFNAVAQ